MNLFPVSTLLAFLCCTAYSGRRGHKTELSVFSSLAMEKIRSWIPWQITAEQNPSHKLRPSCTIAIYRYLTAKQEPTTVVSKESPASPSTESKTMRHLFQAHAARQKQLHSSHHSSEQEPVRWMFLHFPQWVHKMFIRIILLFYLLHRSIQSGCFSQKATAVGCGWGSRTVAQLAHCSTFSHSSPHWSSCSLGSSVDRKPLEQTT